MPLVHLAELFGGSRNNAELLQVVVHNSTNGSVGFVVDAIEDIVESDVTARGQNDSAAVVGARVVQGLVTELLDAEAVCATVQRP